jgi:hypothetical protein
MRTGLARKSDVVAVPDVRSLAGRAQMLPSPYLCPSQLALTTRPSERPRIRSQGPPVLTSISMVPSLLGTGSGARLGTSMGP